MGFDRDFGLRVEAQPNLLTFFFIREVPITTAVTMTDQGKHTVVDWSNMCREVCSSVVRASPSMIGIHLEPI